MDVHATPISNFAAWRLLQILRIFLISLNRIYTVLSFRRLRRTQNNKSATKSKNCKILELSFFIGEVFVRSIALYN